MHKTFRRKALVAVVLALAALPVVASTATADQIFHTSHAALTPIGNAPLRSGFVNDIHTNGVVNSAQERYQLNGAMPTTTYTVTLWVYFSDPTCSAVPPFLFPTSTFTTNASGNGEAGFTFPASPSTAPPTLNGIRWVITSGGVPQYQTACVPVTF